MLNLSDIRKDFPILNTKLHGHPLVYLDNAATMQMPEPVLRAITEHYHMANSNVHRGVHALSQRSTDAMEQARGCVARFLGAEHNHEIVFTSGTTDSINMVARAFSEQILGSDCDVIVSAMEHHSNLVPWQEACNRTGARLRAIPLTSDGQLDMDAFQQMLSSKTVIVSIAWVSNVLGTVNPIKEIVRLSHQHGVPVLVDGAQAMKMGQIDVKDLDCDFLAFSGHKIGALTGIGVLYGKEALLNRITPINFGGGMIDKVKFTSSTYGSLPFKFEAGTPNYVGAISLGAAINYLTDIGVEKIGIYEHELTKYVCHMLTEFPELHILGHPDNRCGVISFYADGVHPYDLGALLDAQGIAVRTGNLCAKPLLDHFGINGAIRVSPAFYNSKVEINSLHDGIEKALFQLKGRY